MHRSLRHAALVAFIAAPLSVGAQPVERTFQFGLSAGLTMPLGDIADVYSSGYGVTGHVWLRPQTFTNLSFRGDVGFDRFEAKESSSLSPVTSEGTFTAIGVLGNAVFSFPQSDPSAILRPYILGGLGFHNTKSKVTSTIAGVEGTQESSDTNLGMQAGGGLVFNLSGFSTFAEVKLVNVFGDGSSVRWVPITFGFRF